MKKKVLASLLCASMVATMFAGCGSSNGNGTEKADKKAGGKETITVMGPSEDLDDAKGAWLKTECEAFAKANPDFNIEFKYVTSSESDAKDVVTKDPKAAADVYMFANDQLEPLIKANAIAKLYYIHSIPQILRQVSAVNFTDTELRSPEFVSLPSDGYLIRSSFSRIP